MRVTPATPLDDLPTLLTKRELATVLGVSGDTVERLLRTGEFRYVKLGVAKSSPVRIPKESLVKLLAPRSEARRYSQRQVDAEYRAAMLRLKGGRA